MDDYYKEQAGSGIGGFAGLRYQKGHGFFGRMISGTMLPILKKVLPYLGKTALATGTEILGDIEKGENFKSSAKRRLKETGQAIGQKAMSKVKQITGEGRRKRRRRATKKSRKVKRCPPACARKPAKRQRKRRKSKRKSRKSTTRSAKDFV